MPSLRVLLLKVLLLASSACAFQSIHNQLLSRQSYEVTKNAVIGRHQFRPTSRLLKTKALILRRATPEDDSKEKLPATSTTSGSDGSDSQEVTDLDKTSFEIAKEYMKTGIPEDSSKSDGFKFDTFSM